MTYDELLRARRIREHKGTPEEIRQALARADRDLRTARVIMAEDWDWRPSDGASTPSMSCCEGESQSTQSDLFVIH